MSIDTRTISPFAALQDAISAQGQEYRVPPSVMAALYSPDASDSVELPHLVNRCVARINNPSLAARIRDAWRCFWKKGGHSVPELKRTIVAIDERDTRLAQHQRQTLLSGLSPKRSSHDRTAAARRLQDVAGRSLLTLGGSREQLGFDLRRCDYYLATDHPLPRSTTVADFEARLKEMNGGQELPLELLHNLLVVSQQGMVADGWQSACSMYPAPGDVRVVEGDSDPASFTITRNKDGSWTTTFTKQMEIKYINPTTFRGSQIGVVDMFGEMDFSPKGVPLRIREGFTPREDALAVPPVQTE